MITSKVDVARDWRCAAVADAAQIQRCRRRASEEIQKRATRFQGIKAPSSWAKANAVAAEAAASGFAAT